MNFERHITCKLKPSFLKTAVTVFLDCNEAFGRIKYLLSINHLKDGKKRQGYCCDMLSLSLLREWGIKMWFCACSQNRTQFYTRVDVIICEHGVLEFRDREFRNYPIQILLVIVSPAIHVVYMFCSKLVAIPVISTLIHSCITIVRRKLSPEYLERVSNCSVPPGSPWDEKRRGKSWWKCGPVLCPSSTLNTFQESASC